MQVSIQSILRNKVKKEGTSCLFEKRSEQLKAYEAKRGHCNVKGHLWKMNDIKSDEVLLVAGLSEDAIKRFEDLGFDWRYHNCKYDDLTLNILNMIRSYSTFTLRVLRFKNCHAFKRVQVDKQFQLSCYYEQRSGIAE